VHAQNTRVKIYIGKYDPLVYLNIPQTKLKNIYKVMSDKVHPVLGIHSILCNYNARFIDYTGCLILIFR
jgi:hypothetical protein